MTQARPEEAAAMSVVVVGTSGAGKSILRHRWPAAPLKLDRFYRSPQWRPVSAQAAYSG